MYESLQQIRKAKKATCFDMAQILGLQSKSAYQKKESGRVPFRLEEAKAVSEKFDMPIETIFFGNEVSFKETGRE